MVRIQMREEDRELVKERVRMTLREVVNRKEAISLGVMDRW